MKVFYPKWQCPKCEKKFGFTEDEKRQITQKICNTCSWGNKY